MLSPKDIEYFENFRSKIDNKFHYVYKITNLQNNYYYFGVHSTTNINDGYMGSGNLIKRAIKSVGKENFAKEFIKFFETSDESFNCESELVDENMIKNPNCYNLALGGRDGIGKTGKINKHTKGRIHVNNGVVEKMIYPHDKQEYLNEGWIIGCICRPQRRKIYVNKNGRDLRIWRDELQDYLNTGWNRSSISNTGKIHINNGVEHKMINPEDLQRYLDDGWERGNLKKIFKDERIYVFKFIDDKKIYKPIKNTLLRQYIDDGWLTTKQHKKSS